LFLQLCIFASFLAALSSRQRFHAPIASSSKPHILTVIFSIGVPQVSLEYSLGDIE